MERIEELIRALTLEEKIGMIHGCGFFRTEGVKRLGIPPLVFSDGPMGVRNELENGAWIPAGNDADFVSYLPSGGALAASWNRSLAEEIGRVLGEEARGRGKDMILSPGVNIKRSPLCGRNFEYMSEDPYLTGELAVRVIRGIQTADVAACVKHFALNSQETERFWVDSEADECALREIYLPAFEKAVKEGGTLSLMGAYNRYHGEHCCESSELLDEILRDEWGYDGTVISDWGAVHNTEKAARCSLDVEMSGENNFDDYCLANPLKEAVLRGEIDEAQIDEKVRRILKMMYRLHMLGGGKRKAGAYNTPEHRERTLEAARESVVLLKNDRGVLPLSEDTAGRVLVVGDNAVRRHAPGGGSAEIKALYEISPLMGIKMLLGGNAEVDFVQGYIADDCEEKAERVSNLQDNLRREAVAHAAFYDTVIFIGGQNHSQDTEGRDRKDMKLPYRQDELLAELLKARPDTVVVMVSGSPVEMPWAEHAGTLLWQWYAGMEGGYALAEVLFGRVSPSGRLPETFPVSLSDCPAHCIGDFGGEKQVHYREGLFVGYRYFTSKKVPVLFPFGFGLSYTEFAFENLCVTVEEAGSAPRVRVSLDVTNTGARDGKEVVQIYVGKDGAGEALPALELKGFEKVSLAPGETKRVELLLTEEAFRHFSKEQKRFAVEPGGYTVFAGKSAQELLAKESFTL